MDIDLTMKSSPPQHENQEEMGMITMMIQMEKHLPLQEMHFISNTNNNNVHEIYQNTNNPFITTSTPTIQHEQQLLFPLQPNPPYAHTRGSSFSSFSQAPAASSFLSSAEKKNSTAAIREMIFRIAAMQPIHIDPESIKPPKRRNVKISKDPQSVAARHRRERISERIRILQRLVPGGTKMDTASMLDEAIHYVKFLKKQVQSLEQIGANRHLTNGNGLIGNFAASMSTTSNGLTNFVMPNLGYLSLVKNCQPHSVIGSNSTNINVGSSMQMLR